LLDLGEDGRNYKNEGVTLLEHRYGDPSLPWSKITKRFNKDQDAAAKDVEGDQKKRRGRSGSIGSADGHKDEAARATSTSAMEVDTDGNPEEDESPDADVLLDEPFEERPDLLRGDDAWLMLERMQDLTVRALHLQERFRKEYRQQQQDLLSSGSQLPHPLSLGDGQLLQELKFSNDNLRWRLRQKQASLGNAQDTVTLLKTNVLQLEQKLDRKTSEWRDSVAEVSCL